MTKWSDSEGFTLRERSPRQITYGPTGAIKNQNTNSEKEVRFVVITGWGGRRGIGRRWSKAQTSSSKMSKSWGDCSEHGCRICREAVKQVNPMSSHFMEKTFFSFSITV